SKHSGKCSSLNRSRIAGSLAFACLTKLSGGLASPPSRQWTAICDSESPTDAEPELPSLFGVMTQVLSVLLGCIQFFEVSVEGRRRRRPAPPFVQGGDAMVNSWGPSCGRPMPP